MNTLTPHYLLFADADRAPDSGRWRFTLRTPDGAKRFEAADEEPEARGERLDLLTLVRALESLDEPSRITLVGCSSYLRQGMLYGLPEWRDNGWQWECFGQMVPVKNRDLWQRVDRAMAFHRVECRWWRIDGGHYAPPAPQMAACATGPARRHAPPARRRVQHVFAAMRMAGRALVARLHRWAAASAETCMTARVTGN